MMASWLVHEHAPDAHALHEHQHELMQIGAVSPLLPGLCTTVRHHGVAALLCSFVNSVTDKLTGTLSLGAAVFASVLIASCMPAEMDVVGACLPGA